MGEYPGQILHASYPRGRKGGVFRATEAGLVFDTGDQRVEIPLGGLRIETGGSGDRLTYFRSPALPEHAFYASDKAILADPLFTRTPELAAAAQAARRSHGRGRLVFAGIAALLAGLLALLFLAYDPLVFRVARAMPYAWEKALGDKMAPLVTESSRRIEDPELEAQLALITGPLIKAAGRPDMTFTFSLVENTEPNAFALPGGQVVIYSGLLLKARRAEEVAGVVAHEIAHVTQRHHMRGLLKNAGLFVLVQTLLGDATAAGAVIAEYTTSLSSLSYSRGFEREADRVAWDYLTRAGIDPRGMAEFFQGLLEDRGETARALERNLSLLSTHPATEDRIRALEKLPRAESYAPLAIDYPAFRSLLEKRLPEAPGPESGR